MPKVARFLLALAFATTSLPALAQQPEHVTTLDTVYVTGHARVPIAAIEVKRVAPTVRLTELRQPFATRVGEAVCGAPF
jgi:hypothetical protein